MVNIFTCIIRTYSWLYCCTWSWLYCPTFQPHMYFYCCICFCIHVFSATHVYHTCLPHISSNCNLTSCDSTCGNLSSHFSALRNKNWSKNRLVWFEQFHFLCWAVAISKKVLTNCDSSYPNLSIWPFDPLAGEKLIKKYMRFFCNFN